jgi:hypothetical protein
MAYTKKETFTIQVDDGVTFVIEKDGTAKTNSVEIRQIGASPEPISVNVPSHCIADFISVFNTLKWSNSQADGKGNSDS